MNEVRVSFLKALLRGHANAETVVDELWKALQELNLSVKYLLSLCTTWSKLQEVIKASINRKLVAKYNMKLVDTGPCQLHVVHNSFRRGIEARGEDIENCALNFPTSSNGH